jgi:hypothetical protein
MQPVQANRRSSAMTQQYVTGILVAALTFGTTFTTYARQEKRPDVSSRSVALRLRPDMLAMFINNIAGLRVRIVSGVVDDIVSSRVFTLKNERSLRFPNRPNEVAIVVDSGSAAVREGAAVVVIGIARTLLGAEMNTDRPLQALTEGERNALARLPVVMASSVQTPDGVQLGRPNP